ncbi:MAG: hypothetical protein R3D82_13240 [Xanthobacteraceae bacterium]
MRKTGKALQWPWKRGISRNARRDRITMNLLKKLFRRPVPIRDVEALADFIDAQSAFITQKGIFEYSRARAGHYAKVLFAEEGFARSVDRARWQAFPLGLSMVGEMIEGVVASGAGTERRQLLDRLTSVVLSVLDRYPVSPSIGEEAWQEARRELAHRLDLVGAHAPKRVMDIPDALAKAYFDTMPIHEKLRGRDFGTTRNYLSVCLCNIHDEFVARADVAALRQALSSGDKA